MTGCDLKLSPTDKNLSGNVYTLTGDYKVTCDSDYEKTGTFEIQCTITNGKETLKSVKLESED